MTNLNKLIATICLFLLAAGCQSIDVRGQFVSDEALQEINRIKPTQEVLAEMIGTPTYIPDYSPNTWYYVQRSLAKRAGFAPKLEQQRVVKIDFAYNKVVSAVLIDEKNDNISMHTTITETHGTKQTGIQKFVKNIGRFNKSATTSLRKKKTKQ